MLVFDRRSFLQTTGVGVVAAASSNLNDAIAADAGSPAEAPGFYRFSLGEIRITSLCDGLFFLPTDSIATNVEAGEKKAYFDAHYIAPDVFRLQANPLLIETEQKRILVDTGVGPGKSWAPYAGRLTKCLEQAGIGLELDQYGCPDPLSWRSFRRVWCRSGQAVPKRGIGAF